MAQDYIGHSRPLHFSLAGQPSSLGRKSLGIWNQHWFSNRYRRWHTVFTLSFQGDYYLDSEFSIGPQLLITPGGNLTQITFAGITRYHIPLGAVALIPFGEIGFFYADYEPGRNDDNNASYIFPLRATAAFHISWTRSLASTLIFTVQDLDCDNRRKSANFNIGLQFGFRFHP